MTVVLALDRHDADRPDRHRRGRVRRPGGGGGGDEQCEPLLFELDVRRATDPVLPGRLEAEARVGGRGAAWATGAGGAPTGVTGPPRRREPGHGLRPRRRHPALEDEDRRRGHERRPGRARRGGDLPGPAPHHQYALNLVAGDELAWQDRKAESFFLTAAHCGSAGTGLCPDDPVDRPRTDARPRHVDLGRRGRLQHRPAPVTALIALMTAFNARLGWWMRNPNPATWRFRWLPGSRCRADWDAGSPSLALPLLLELVGDDQRAGGVRPPLRRRPLREPRRLRAGPPPLPVHRLLRRRDRPGGLRRQPREHDPALPDRLRRADRDRHRPAGPRPGRRPQPTGTARSARSATTTSTAASCRASSSTCGPR